VSVKSSWRHLGASVVGTSHIRRNLPCQDAYSWIALDNGIVIGAVADGAGSADRSQEGSALAVRSAAQFLAGELKSGSPREEAQCVNLLHDALRYTRAALEELAPGPDLRHVATTLLLAFVTDDWAAIAQIGDGGIVAEFNFEELYVLTVPGDSEYINETTFITSSEFLSEAHYTVTSSSKLTGLALFSDGLQLLALQHSANTAHKPFFVPCFTFVSERSSTVGELEEFLSSARVCERTDDDKTLILAVRDDATRPER
jgi:hypothetical protein